MALLSVAEALRSCSKDAQPLPSENVPLAEAHGRVLAADLAALRTQPPADVSAMDGYAVRAADVATAPARLKLIGEVAAGHPFDRPVGAGEAARIFTGGVVPPGADTIVIQEHTAREGDTVVVQRAERKGRHIRREGLDFKRGRRAAARAAAASARATSRSPAAMNHADCAGAPRARVAVLATGDELVMPGTHAGPGQIVYSNGYCPWRRSRGRRRRGRSTSASRPTGSTRPSPPCGARASAGVDVLVTTGGASVGEHDLVQKALRGRRHGAVVLEGGAAPRPAADARPARRHAGARPARQSGVGLRVRRAVSGAAAPPARRPRRLSGRASNRPCSAATCRRTTSAPTTCAPSSTVGPDGTPGRDPVRGPGQFHAGAPRQGRLPRDSRDLTRPRRKPGSRCAIVKLGVLRTATTLARELKGCGTHVEQIGSVHDLFMGGRSNASLGQPQPGEWGSC